MFEEKSSFSGPLLVVQHSHRTATLIKPGGRRLGVSYDSAALPVAEWKIHLFLAHHSALVSITSFGCPIPTESAWYRSHPVKIYGAHLAKFCGFPTSSRQM